MVWPQYSSHVALLRFAHVCGRWCCGCCQKPHQSRVTPCCPPPLPAFAGKLSELAVLALYLMYEKKVGKQSFWRTYIKELDRQRARGVQAVESPLLWSDEELAALLQVGC